MNRAPWFSFRPAAGFTLIEVIGALVIFSIGVLMVVQVSGALGMQMRYAGARSQLAVLANERLDSLEAETVASMTPGTATDTLSVAGITYERTVTVTSVTSVLARIEVGFAATGGGGPTLAVTSYVSDPW